MLSIKNMLRVKSFKKKLRVFYYKLVKPLAYIETCICNRKDKKYKLRQIEIEKWTDEYAIKLYSKVLIKQMVKSTHRYGWFEEIVIADWCNNDYNLYNIRDYIISQNIDKNLRSWGYKLPYRDLDRFEKLTDLLKIELEKYDEVKCEYIVDKEKYGCYKSKNYIKTLIVEIDKG